MTPCCAVVSDGPRAVVVGVQLPGVDDREHQSSLDELERLTRTLGLQVIARITQTRPSLSKASVVGEGKLKELAQLTGGTGLVPSGAPVKRQRKDLHDEDDDPGEAEPEEAKPDDDKRAKIVVVDHDLSPSQARNLERATSAEVMDRTAVILAIFQRHARTREARLQVEIARLHYLAPRLREVGGGGDRQRGGIGGRGAGESALELDKRKVRDRIAELRRELDAIEHESKTRRRRRAENNTVALVGYTNAGKSSLMRGLTGSEVYVADKLFATLDTTVRALQPETRPRILVSDTVGFIKKLPHDLVASFRSTLEEAADADLLIHVVDASDPAFRAQIEVTRVVLEEIGANEAPRWLALNKIDRLHPDVVAELGAEFQGALLMSAKARADVAALHDRIQAHFERDMLEDEILVPYTSQHRVAEIHAACRVLSESYDESGTRVRVRAPKEILARLRSA
jgi:GTP-binding protein HflX